jgi:glucose-6-phosphate isomerase
MSVIRPKPPEDPIEYAPTARAAASGAAEASAVPIEALVHAREAAGDDPVVRIPEQLLADYNGTSAGRPAGRTRATSELFAILQAARGIRDTVDRMIVAGDAGAVQAVRAVFSCCCHPFHNELPRGERGGRPRLSFVGHPLDADALQGLVDLVAPAGAARTGDLLEQWGVVLCAGDDESPAARLLPRLLARSVGDDPSRTADRVATVLRPASSDGDVAHVAHVAHVTQAVGSRHAFVMPDVAGERGVLTAACLLPLAIVGIDVVRLLQGAVLMNRRFREAAADLNPALQCAAVSRLAGRRGHAPPRLVSPDTDRLFELARWHELLATGHAGAAAVEAAAQVTLLRAGAPRRDPEAAVPLATAGGFVRGRDGASAPQPTTAAGVGPHVAAVVHLPRIDEHAIGQLLQMHLLAAVVEERLPD